MTRKTIAIIGNQGFSMVNFRGALIKDLVLRGHKVYALAPEIGLEAAEALRSLGAGAIEIQLSRTGINPVKDAISILNLSILLKRLCPDVTLSYAAKPAIYGTLAAWFAGVGSRFAMIEGLGYVFVSPPKEGPARRLLRRVVIGLYRLALSRSEKVFFLNPDDVADSVSLRLVAHDRPVNIGGIGVDLEEWREVSPVISPVVFLFVGRLLKDKGILEFVSAAREVKSRHPEARFVIAGACDINPQSIQQRDIEGWVSEGLVEWVGHVPVQPIMRQASVFVLPSFYREGVPRSTQEAMAMGRPVVTTDSVGCRETVAHGRNGFLVPVRDPVGLAAAMKRFIDEPDLIVAMGRASREMAEERFDVRKVNAKIIETMGL